MQSEPHKIIVRVWYDAKFHDIEMNAATSPILRELFHRDPREYFNPTPAEWSALVPYRLPERAK